MRWITSLPQSVKKIEARILSLSHSAEVFEVWNTHLSSIVKILLSWLTIFFITVSKKWKKNDKVVKQCQRFCGKSVSLFCLTVSNSLRVEIHFQITRPKFFRFDLQVWLTMSKKLRGELQLWLAVSKIYWLKRITILSHSVVKFGIWLTILSHSAKKFELWNTNLTHCVERFAAKNNLNLDSQCGNVCDLNYKFVSRCRKFWEVILNFVSPWGNLCEVNYSFVSQRHIKLTFEKQVCLTVSKNLRAESKLCLTVSKSLRSELQVCLKMSKILWPEYHKLLSKHGTICKTI